MPADPLDPDNIFKAVTQAYNLSCCQGDAIADKHVHRIHELAAATAIIMSKWKHVAYHHPAFLEKSWKNRVLTKQKTLYCSLGSFATYSALMALEVFASISGELSAVERERLGSCMENYALAYLAVSLCRTWSDIRLLDDEKTRNVRRGINLPALANKQKVDKTWITEAQQFVAILLTDKAPLVPGIAAGTLSYSIALRTLRLADQTRAKNHDANPDRALALAIQAMEPVAESSMRILLALHASSWAKLTSV